jgi:predicted regulator of Ras-like GTPase activity (Roadblock/LC7/MglB family)
MAIPPNRKSKSGTVTWFIVSACATCTGVNSRLLISDLGVDSASLVHLSVEEQTIAAAIAVLLGSSSIIRALIG